MTVIKDILEFDHNNDAMAIAKHFFNSLSHSDFADTIERILNHKHVADEYHGCSFPHDVDYDEEPFEGVKFRRVDDELIVDENTFRSLVRDACTAYLKVYPNHSERIETILAKVQGPVAKK